MNLFSHKEVSSVKQCSMRSNRMLEQYSSLSFNMSDRNSHFSIKQNRKHHEQELRLLRMCARFATETYGDKKHGSTHRHIISYYMPMDLPHPF